MAKKNTTSRSETDRAKLLSTRDDAKQRLELQINKGMELKEKNIPDASTFEDVRTEYYRWDTFNGNLLKAMFSTDEYRNQYHFGIGGSDSFQSLEHAVKSLRDDIDWGIRKLRNVFDAIDLIEEDSMLQGSRTGERDRPQSNRVFVVHGHDEAAKQEAARLLTKLKLNAVILGEQENLGRTIIEKFEHYSDVGFAVVLLTPDDLGATAVALNKEGASALSPRARQNVVFEMGFFYGKLGRSKVCALLKPGTDRPSDLDGIVYTSMDPAGAWKTELAKEMKAAGLPVDLNDLF